MTAELSATIPIGCTADQCIPAQNAGSVSVVVPVYNSEAMLGELVSRIEATVSQLAVAYEIVFVNDGSRDGSWKAIEQAAARHPSVHGIDLMRNYGQHSALLAGIRHAKGNIIVTLDDDLQNPPEEIPKLLAVLAVGYDVVYGTPDRQRHGIWRDTASVVTKVALRSAMGVEVANDVSAFRAFRTHLRDAFTTYQGPFVSIDVLLTWATTRFGAVEVRHDPREIGPSNYTFGKLMRHALNMMTGFSTLPLELASVAGFASTIFGLLVLVYVIGRYAIEGASVAGFPFLASIIAIFSGVQLFALGIIGEYLARMHFRMMERPAYAVRSRIGQE